MINSRWHEECDLVKDFDRKKTALEQKPMECFDVAENTLGDEIEVGIVQRSSRGSVVS